MMKMMFGRAGAGAAPDTEATAPQTAKKAEINLMMVSRGTRRGPGRQCSS